jgi:2-hydroxychromene-2-carboxylate isomerase
MIIAKRLKGKAIATWLGPTGEAARRAVAELKNKVTGRGEARRLDLYFDIADPWSYIAAQVARRLVDAYGIELGVTVITPPASDVDPAPLLRVKHAVRDAQLLADYWNIDFPGKREADPTMLREVSSSLIIDRPAAEQLTCALELTTAMWSGDKKQLALLLGKWGTESTIGVPPILNAHYEALRKAGHYQGAMLAYGGEWYWGVDRLRYLEDALAHDTGKPAANVVVAREDRGPLALSEKPLACEMWFSFRSPYSYLALEQIEAVLEPAHVPLVLRPVLPMVTRGLALPAVKRMYIVRDAKREADRLGIEFGEICDPLGAGVDNCLAIAHWANQQGKLLAFAKSAMRGIWAEARDMSEYVDLRYVVERAGLPWAEAKASLGNEAAVKWANANVADLAVISLWGVPSFRCGDFIAWGQDRLPLLADRLRRHALKNPS